ncbi:hypothetical protein U1Q18_013936, partial [Sarracenia purpurea var. burkii]
NIVRSSKVSKEVWKAIVGERTRASVQVKRCFSSSILLGAVRRSQSEDGGGAVFAAISAEGLPSASIERKKRLYNTYPTTEMKGEVQRHNMLEKKKFLLPVTEARLRNSQVR